MGANWFDSATVDVNIINYTLNKEEQNKIEAYKINLCDDINKNKKIIEEKYFICSKKIIVLVLF